ncbi:hypothetical protein PINS_up022988, partial [Pythium insidiosum]
MRAVVASDLFPVVHAFLVRAGLKKSAKALADEAKLAPKSFRGDDDLVAMYKQFVATKKPAVKAKKEEIPAASVVD